MPGHYFVVERLDTVTGRYDLAQSALVLKAAAGRCWYGLNEIGSLGAGAPTHAIYLATQPAAQLMAASAAPFRSIATAVTSIQTGTRVVATGGTRRQPARGPRDHRHDHRGAGGRRARHPDRRHGDRGRAESGSG